MFFKEPAEVLNASGLSNHLDESLNKSLGPSTPTINKPQQDELFAEVPSVFSGERSRKNSSSSGSSNGRMKSSQSDYAISPRYKEASPQYFAESMASPNKNANSSVSGHENEHSRSLESMLKSNRESETPALRQSTSKGEIGWPSLANQEFQVF